MKQNYKNWVPNGMIAALTAGTAVFGAGTAALLMLGGSALLIGKK